MTSTTSARIYLGASRVRRLRIASIVAFLVMTISAVALFFITLELSLRLPQSNPYSDIYLLVASASPLAVLLHGLGVLLLLRHADHDTLDPAARTRIIRGGIACTLLAAITLALTPLVTPPPFSDYAWIAAPSLALTCLLSIAAPVALRGEEQPPRPDRATPS